MSRRLLILSLTLALLGCESKRPAHPSNLPTTQMSVGSKTYTLEVAASESDRNHGLMERDAMPADHGMIFLFPADQMQRFWMENTRIALDIVYVNDAGSVVSVKRMLPYKRDTIPSDAPARFAIELNAGEAEANGVKAGDRVDVPAAIRATPSDPEP